MVSETPDEYPCGAGHSYCYISPSGDVTPCVAYSLVCGNLREKSFGEIWRSSPGFASVRAARTSDLHVCRACPNASVCNRCPGLAYKEGDALGPSALDCRQAFARTGIPSPPILRVSDPTPRPL